MSNKNPANLRPNSNIDHNSSAIDASTFFDGSSAKSVLLRQLAVMRSWHDDKSLCDSYCEHFCSEDARNYNENEDRDSNIEHPLYKAFWARIKSAIDALSSSVWFDRVSIIDVDGPTITLRAAARPTLSEDQKEIIQDAAKTAFGDFVKIVVYEDDKIALLLAASQNKRVSETEDYKTYTEALKCQLRQQVDETIFCSWFSSMQLEKLEHETATLSVPVKFIRNWLQSHYSDEITKALEAVFPEIQRFNLVIRQVRDKFISDFSKLDRKILQAVNDGTADWESLVNLRPELFKSQHRNRTYDLSHVLLRDRIPQNVVDPKLKRLQRRVDFIAERVQENCLELIEITGRIKWFDPAKGYGFIVPDNGLPDVLLHVTSLRSSGHKRALEQAHVHCQAVNRRFGLEVFRILSIDESSALHPSDLPSTSGATTAPESHWERVTVKWFNRVRGFGFLARGTHHPDIYVDIKVLRRSGLVELRPGDVLEMRWGHGRKGVCATELRPFSAEQHQPQRPRQQPDDTVAIARSSNSLND